MGRSGWGASGPVARALRRAAGAAVETVYPRRCAGCERRGAWVCPACDRALARYAPPWCARCGAPLLALPCRCADLPPALAAARSAGPFAGWLRGAILALKYRDERARAPHLAALLPPLLADLGPCDGLVPVPLHPRRERRRGYNQAALLAEGAAALGGPPLRPLLVRTRDTPQQTGLGAADRRANAAGAFRAAVPPAPGARLVLVDDVLTTGATLAACADALLAAGAGRVAAITLARET